MDRNVVLLGFLFASVIVSVVGVRTSAAVVAAGLEKAQRMLRAAAKSEESQSQSCTTMKPRRRRSTAGNSVLDRYPRQLAPNLANTPFTPLAEPDAKTTALYFNGKQALRMKHLNKLYKKSSTVHQLTVSIWIRPEGGQRDPVTIIGMEDWCMSTSEAFGWSVGLRTKTASDSDDHRSGQVYFSVRTEYSARATVILDARQHHEPDRWTHVAATYDGHGMALYVQGARVAAAAGRASQRGAVFTSASRGCRTVSLARGVAQAGFYRGAVDDLRIWNHSLAHDDIARLYRRSTVKVDAGLLFSDSLDDQTQWEAITDSRPRSVVSDTNESAQRLYLKTPACGKTVCDDPRVVSAYAERWELRLRKTLRYRVINVMNDDGSNAMVTQKQIRYQDSALRYAFRPYNISWQVETTEFRNTSLRARTVLLRCQPAKVGNGQCNPECLHDSTGGDGGDCDAERIFCDARSKGDGHCDSGCNRAYHDWDGGDCCHTPRPDVKNVCYQPTSPHRAYISVAEYKQLIGFSGKTHLNIFFGQWSGDEGPIGLATFPWEKDVHTILGGVLVQADKFGRPGDTDSLIHELGHALGLWHVFHGVSEMDCTDPCLETEASLALGDMCADTSPTPKNHACRDPDTTEERTCGLGVFYGTPYKNYMAYTDDDCTDHFSDQQMARMHCYIDMVYQSVQKESHTTPLPLAPRALSSDSGSVSVSWVPPLGIAASDGGGSICAYCLPDYALLQYADKAWSPNSTNTYGNWATAQATGAPDADECYASANAWTPDAEVCHNGCALELSFKYPIVPRRLSLWVVWYVGNAIRDIQLLYEDDTVYSLGRPPVPCDAPFTTELNIAKILTKVIVTLSSPFASVDAVSIQSDVGHGKCKRCKSRQYAVQRSPPFSDMRGGGGMIEDAIVREAFFVDRTVISGEQYSYRVKPLSVGSQVPFSRPLVYTHGGPYCGDGEVQQQLGEQCDDGNVADEDGCDSNCLVEETFHCRAGSPSMCYIYAGDGRCEEFEREDSVRDCGFFTPAGFKDQVAVSALANPSYQRSECPSELAAGPPTADTKCDADFDGARAWFPCGHFDEDADYWLQLTFARPVIASAVLIYFASDGTSAEDTRAKAVHVTAIDTDDVTHTLGIVELGVSCRGANPARLNVTHDLNLPFFQTKAVVLSFRSHHIAVAAVVLRSSATLDPLAVSACANRDGHLYNVHTRQCTTYQCERPSCPHFAVEFGVTACGGHLEGDVCTAVCDRGYTLEWVGERQVMCVAGRWRGAIKCSPVDCGVPFVPYATAHCTAGTKLGNRCRFECHPAAKQKGSNHTLTCESSGLWSVPRAVCRVSCSGPPVVQNATLVTRRCRRSGDHQLGTVCRLTCQAGFYATGSKSTKRQSIRQACTAAGVWRGGHCERVQCPQINIMYHGLYSCSDKLWMKSNCTLKCIEPRQVVSTITCKPNGQWSGQFTRCSPPPGECPAPPISETVAYRCNDRRAGTACEITCTGVDYKPAIANALKFEKLTRPHVWTDTAVCTFGLRWYPDISNILCMKRCLATTIGDGYCDRRNNRLTCEWDGGDCCQSTVVGGVVIPSSHSCDNDGCTCKDPNAAEHRRTLRMRAHSRHYHANRG